MCITNVQIARTQSEGGLMLVYGLYPGTPLENARAVMDAMEHYSDYHTH